MEINDIKYASGKPQWHTYTQITCLHKPKKKKLITNITSNYHHNNVMLLVYCANPPIRRQREVGKKSRKWWMEGEFTFVLFPNYSISIKISHLFYRLDLVSHSHYSFHFGQRGYEGLFHLLNELKHLHNVCWFTCTMPKEENCVVWHFALLFTRASHFFFFLRRIIIIWCEWHIQFLF